MVRLRSLVHWLGRLYVARITKGEAEAQKLQPINERPIELAFLFEEIRDLQPRRVLDVGPGQNSLPALIGNCNVHVTAIDNVTDYWSNGLTNRHWYVVDDDIRQPKHVKGPFDLVTCISVIEHISEHVAAFRSMAKLARPGGHVLVTCPYNEKRFVDDVYKLPGANAAKVDYHCSSYNRQTVDQWLGVAPVDLVRQEYWRLWTGDVWRQGERLQTPERASANDPHQISCMLFRRASEQI